VPVLVWLLVSDAGAEGSRRWWALAVFAGASLTDFLDGYLARRWAVVTSFGKLADPIADKALLLSTMLCVVVIDGVPWWPVAVLAVREIVITVGRLLVAKQVVIAASLGGKLKTLFQSVAAGLYLWPHQGEVLDRIAWIALLIAVALALVSGVTYAKAIMRAARMPASVAEEAVAP